MEATFLCVSQRSSQNLPTWTLRDALDKFNASKPLVPRFMVSYKLAELDLKLFEILRARRSFDYEGLGEFSRRVVGNTNHCAICNGGVREKVCF